MTDIDLIVQQLRAHNHTVEHVNPVPANAGEYEFMVDGQLRSLLEVRAILEDDAGA